MNSLNLPVILRDNADEDILHRISSQNQWLWVIMPPMKNAWIYVMDIQAFFDLWKNGQVLYFKR